MRTIDVLKAKIMKEEIKKGREQPFMNSIAGIVQ